MQTQVVVPSGEHCVLSQAGLDKLLLIEDVGRFTPPEEPRGRYRAF